MHRHLPHAGSNVVASLVVFEDGLAKKRDYRHFAIHGEAATDDTASMYDVVSRRFSRYLEQMASDEPDDRFGYRPSLLVVDGAGPRWPPPRGIVGPRIVDISVVGLAKRLEEVWVPDDPFPVILPRNSEGSSSCSACATKPTGSRSPTTGRSGRRR